jgi:glycosyltransferase involved in cell wall biosynthesis
MKLERGSMRVSIIAPVFNDWECLGQLLMELPFSKNPADEISIHVIDDGSTESMPSDFGSHGLYSVEVTRVASNVGHQRAIAIGLVDVANRVKPDVIVVMDADGEDDPNHLTELIGTCGSNPGCIVVAQRQQRVATTSFRWLYGGYKTLFRWATGRRLDFGNFSAMSSMSAERLCAMPELWNHYPATIMKSRLPVVRVPLSRRARYFGMSKMNLVSLINHGLSGLAVFTDVVFTRLLILASVLTACLGAVIAAGIVLRLNTDVPIPGWAALSVLASAIGLVQLFCALLILGFLSLSSRASYSPAPREFAASLIAERIVRPASRSASVELEGKA